MNENIDYSEYNEEKNRIPWKRIFITLLILIIAVVIVLFVLKACQGGSLHDDLIKAGKEYYEKYPSSLPSTVGECYTVTLSTLKEEGLIKTKKYDTCDDISTYVNVCYLESRTYHYSAILSCTDENTDYGIWQDGTESDLTDKSDVRFKYLGEEKNSGTKYYYPNNYTDPTKVSEYYSTIPSSGYSGTEDEQTGYKWYKEVSTKDYWKNGEYSSTQPSGYPNKGDSKKITNYSESKPSSATYRTITDTTLYRSQNVTRPYVWTCVNPNNANDVVVSEEPCSGTHSKTKDIKFTCNGKDEVKLTADQIKNKDFPSCGNWSEWTSTKCNASFTDGIKCENKKGYTYTDTTWKWYKTGTGRSYYPSGSSDASKENTYYINAPVSGAIKDESTKATVHKYYKLEQSETGATYEEWMPVTDGYVTLQELIETFRELNYDVNNLNDINQNEQIRYQYKLQYRNLGE